MRRTLTLSKLLFPSRLWPTRGWLAWFLLMGVGGPLVAFSFRGAEMAVKTIQRRQKQQGRFSCLASFKNKANKVFLRHSRLDERKKADKI